MKITFLGTSHGVPEKDRACQSILIEAGDGAYLIDAGAPVANLFVNMGFDLSKIKAIFLTHMHGDHANGLLGFLDLSVWYYLDLKYDIYFPESEGITCFKNMVEMLNRGYKQCPEDRIGLKTVQEGLLYSDNNIRITAVATKHIANIGRSAYGYIIEAEGKKLYISGDLSGELIDYSDIADREEIDMFVVECAHFPVSRLLKKLKTTKAKQIMIVHTWSGMIDVDAEGLKNMPFELNFPCDGEEHII